MAGIWIYPNVRVIALIFCLVVNGIIRQADNGQCKFQTEQGARGLYSELRDAGQIHDTDKCQVFVGIDLDHLDFHSPII